MANTSQSLSTLVEHFVTVCKKDIADAGDAILKGDWDLLANLQRKVAGLEVTASIQSLIDSSHASYLELRARLDAAFSSGAFKLLGGAVLMGAGGVLLTSTGGSAALAILALALLLLGISMCLGAIWDRVAVILDDREQAALDRPHQLA